MLVSYQLSIQTLHLLENTAVSRMRGEVWGEGDVLSSMLIPLHICSDMCEDTLMNIFYRNSSIIYIT
jgi:hypothetical protein